MMNMYDQIQRSISAVRPSNADTELCIQYICILFYVYNTLLHFEG